MVKANEHVCQLSANALTGAAGDFSELQSLIASVDEWKQGSSALEAVRALDHSFHVLFARGDIQLSKSSKTNQSPEALKSQELRGYYNVFVGKLLAILEASGNQKLLISSLRTVMNCVKLNSNQMMVIEKKFAFDNDLYIKLLRALFSRKSSSDLGIVHSLGEFYLAKYDDLLYFTYRNTAKLCADQDPNIRTENVFALLMAMKESFGDEQQLSYFISSESTDSNATHNAHAKTFKKYFSEAWLSFMRHMSLDTSAYKKILAVMHDKLIPNMSEPRLVHGFLTASYNLGGSTGFLALHGVFILITKYNLDYPDFYQKLYQLLNDDVFHMKNRAQLLQLIDIFLKSTHLPASIVCAFLKKLTRLCLNAPIGGILGVLPIIHNLFRRHKSAVMMLHRELPVQEITDIQQVELMIFSDPFNISEMDPVKSGAMESCLWELLALGNHYHPEVAEYVQKFKTPFEKKQMLQDVTKYLNVNHGTFFSQEIETQRQPKLAYEKPNTEIGLLGAKSMLSQCWKLK